MDTRVNNYKKDYAAFPYQQQCQYPQYMELWWADLPLNTASSITGGKRPIIVVSNNRYNKNSGLIFAIPITSRIKRLDLSSHVIIHSENLRKPSMALCEQLRVLDQFLLLRKIGCICNADQKAIRHSIAAQMSLANESATAQVWQ